MIELHNGLPSELSGPAAALLLSVFAEKLLPILGDQHTALAFIESSLTTDNCLSATEDGELLGLLAIQTHQSTFLNPSLHTLRKHYGFLEGLIKGTMLSLLQHRTDPKDIHVEAIAVADTAQGKGIGTRLFGALTEQAQRQGYQAITLEVVDSNPRALQLYERLGFSIIKHSRVWPMNQLFGWPFHTVALMEKTIAHHPN